MIEEQNVLRAVSPNQAWVTSTANEDIVSKYLPNEEVPIFRTLSFLPKQVCTLIINNGTPIIINPELGLELNDRFRYMRSVQIVEAGIDYYFLAGY